MESATASPGSPCSILLIEIKPSQEAVKFSRRLFPIPFPFPLSSCREAGTGPQPWSSSDCPVLHGKSSYLFVRTKTKSMSLKGEGNCRVMICQAASSFPHSSQYGAERMGRHAQALPGKTSKKGVCSLILLGKQGLERPLSLRPYCQVPDAGTVKRSTTLSTQALQRKDSETSHLWLRAAWKQAERQQYTASLCLTASREAQSEHVASPFHSTSYLIWPLIYHLNFFHLIIQPHR